MSTKVACFVRIFNENQGFREVSISFFGSRAVEIEVFIALMTTQV